MTHLLLFTNILHVQTLYLQGIIFQKGVTFYHTIYFIFTLNTFFKHTLSINALHSQYT